MSVEDLETKPLKDPISGAIAQAGRRQGAALDLLLEGAPETWARACHWNSKRALIPRPLEWDAKWKGKLSLVAVLKIVTICA